MNNHDNKLEIFKNDEFGEIRTTIINNEPMFCLSDVCKALGIAQPSKVKNRLSEKGVNTIPTLTTGGEQKLLYINESNLYKTIFQSRKESAERFTDWVTSEVLPTIRKTGGYVNNDELFINTYLPFADEQTKLLFTTTLTTVRKQNKIIENQKNEIYHKQEVINGLVDDVPIYKKKDVINRICRRRSGNYANRYKELYKCFRENFHIDLEARCEGYNLKQPKKKDKLSVIKYAEDFGYIDDLYTCCTKLFEAEIDEVLNQINEIHS